MSFESARTVEEVLGKIHRNEYLMPAIQREFVWGTGQITRLVDSLMRGYPVGSFLLWDVAPQTASEYTFYDFLTNFHERDNPHATKATVPVGQGTVAILDGQQRLTSLNVAVYGSHAEKKKYAWWNSPDAFPKKRLYLNLADDPANEELGLRYDLRFLTDKEAGADPGEPNKWFRVGDVLKLENAGPEMLDEITRRGLLDVNAAYKRLYDLHQAIRVARPMNYFLVTDQDPDKVLEIFVRVNSGGTTLSYSDLLLSMATNQWKDLDAREEVRSLVQELNSGGARQFEFSKDRVLKTALMIAGLDLRFHVSNFTQANMAKVEALWPEIKSALLRAAELLRQFGHSSSTLTADSVIVPIAYYFYRRRLGDSYLVSGADAGDRADVHLWVTRSLLKRGVWGSGLDTTLSRIRGALDVDSLAAFPRSDVETEMAAIGKELAFGPTEVDELLGLKYSGRGTFAVLSLLYPGLDLSKSFHQDHIFPKSLFTRKRLVVAGVPDAKVVDYQAAYDLLPNLQLLEGAANEEKRAKLPAVWIQGAFATRERMGAYIAENDLGGLDLGMDGFLEFSATRQERVRQRLLHALGVGLTAQGSSQISADADDSA